MDVQTIVGIVSIGGVLVGAVAYVVRIEGTTRVLKTDIMHLKAAISGIEGKIDRLLEHIIASPVSSPARRRRYAGKAPSPPHRSR